MSKQGNSEPEAREPAVESTHTTQHVSHNQASARAPTCLGARQSGPCLQPPPLRPSLPFPHEPSQSVSACMSQLASIRNAATCCPPPPPLPPLSPPPPSHRACMQLKLCQRDTLTFSKRHHIDGCAAACVRAEARQLLHADSDRNHRLAACGAQCACEARRCVQLTALPGPCAARAR